jgi:hypothetical protein
MDTAVIIAHTVIMMSLALASPVRGGNTLNVAPVNKTRRVPSKLRRTAHRRSR